MILTQQQAKYAYDAMCLLNAVGGTCDIEFDEIDGFVKFVFAGGPQDDVFVSRANVRLDERHGSQAEFAAAYGLEIAS